MCGSAELDATAAGTRLFDVQINGQAVLQSFDVFAEAGVSSFDDLCLLTRHRVPLHQIASTGLPETGKGTKQILTLPALFKVVYNSAAWQGSQVLLN